MSETFFWLNPILAALGVPRACLSRAEALAAQKDHRAALPLFARAAKAGLPHASYRLGCCYLRGLGVPISMRDALRWLVRAADVGVTAAQTQLASLALQGVSDRGDAGLFGDQSDSSDFERAEYWSRQAAAAGSAEAKALLGFILTAGPVERRDPQAGKALYRQSAEAGWSRGQLAVAMSLLQDGQKDSAVRAMDLLRAAAADGVATAHYVLGTLAESGATGKADLPAAAACYKSAAELGYAAAQLRYGFALLHGRGVKSDAFKAETWLRRAALAGESSASAVLGYLYVQDGELPANYAEAMVWLQRAAETGHAGAARTLAMLYLSGVGVVKDTAEATAWLLVAADSNDEAARGELARLALTGQLGPDDQVAAATCLCHAAESGDVAAQFNFGLCLAQGVGVEQDGRAAMAWVIIAARRGHPPAKQMLAELGEDAFAAGQLQSCE